MSNQERLEQLFSTPRMGHAPLESHNTVRGLYELIRHYFKPEFVMAEIGSFQGVSTMLFAMHVQKIYSIDCYDYVVPESGRIPEMDELLISAEKLFLERTANIKNIVKVRKTSVEAAKEFEDRYFDAVYIDAEHDPVNVKLDINAWKNKIKLGGILCGHDFMLPHIYTILLEEGLVNELYTYPDSSWSVIIK